MDHLNLDKLFVIASFGTILNLGFIFLSADAQEGICPVISDGVTLDSNYNIERIYNSAPERWYCENNPTIIPIFMLLVLLFLDTLIVRARSAWKQRTDRSPFTNYDEHRQQGP